MLTVLLALVGALVYGAADFLGGAAARRVRAETVAAGAAAVGLVPLVVGSAVLGGTLSWDGVWWGAVAGVSGSVAVLLLYRALAIGPMSVLSPVTAVFAAVVPVVVALLAGAVLAPLAVVALVVAVLAVVLVAAVRDDQGARVTASGLLTAAVAGCGFGGIVLAYDMTSASEGLAPLLVARVVQTVLLTTAALVVARRRSGGTVHDPGSAPVPGTSGEHRGRLLRTVLTITGCGLLDALANVFLHAALHTGGDTATLPVVSVLNALYPIGTVVLAGVLLRERLTSSQWTGIVLALGASVGLALA